mgnify:CR=1 FL=1
MGESTVTRAHLTEAVYQEIGLSRNESAELVESVLKLVSDALVRDETVKVSSFGSFSVRQKGQRIGRNPKTGEEVHIPAKRAPFFKVGKELKELVDASDAESPSNNGND